MQMFVAAGWRDGMKNSGGMRDLKSLFWTLIFIKNYLQISQDSFVSKALA